MELGSTPGRPAIGMENPQHPESYIVFYYFVTGLVQWRIESNTIRRFKSTASPVIKYKRAHTWGIGGIGRLTVFQFRKSTKFLYCSIDISTLYMR